MTNLNAHKSPEVFLLKNEGGKFTVVYHGAIDDNAQVESDVRQNYLRSAIDNMLANKKKVSGFGHRVYHTEDPRATHLRRMSEELSKTSGNTKWFDMSRKIELFVKEQKKLNANVDFYSASTYTLLGIDIDLFTPIFAVSRIAGWAAHVIEQHDDNRLIRPRAEYVGPAYPAPYTPTSER